MKKFYTSEGDDGTTGILGQERFPKNHPRIQAVGAVDEASAALGFARAQTEDTEINHLVKKIQEDLYQMMSLLVLEKSNPDKFPELKKSQVEWLEQMVDHYGVLVAPPQGFILPGESITSAAYGVARTIVRRAERAVSALNEDRLLIFENIIPYLNRLSSLCFVLELYTSENPPSQAGKIP
ncbi:MAG: cob(I)yrinic acid a,c-diamide adenosyltransferase [Anaerolineales bacterium]|nr:cob(I)yrinic acid a,c-diamide adenosyltransferase [Anaerolineales bacterium]